MLAYSRVTVKVKEVSYVLWSRNNSTYLANKKRLFQEVSIKVPWGQIAGKWWEPYDNRPILALHGWQDNCGTFDRLIPLLNQDVGFLCIDLPGHGYSSRLPLGVSYFHSAYQITIMAIMDYLKWNKISLMGHSLGGITSYVYSMLFPGQVDFLICFDSAMPLFVDDKLTRIAQQLRAFTKYNNHACDLNESPSYSLEEMTKKICLGSRHSILPEYINYILERNIAASKLHKGKYYFTRDPRLKNYDLVGYSENELIHYAHSLTLPLFLTKSSETSPKLQKVLKVLRKTSTDCAFYEVRGTHHMHLNNPEDVAGLLHDFIKKYTIEDRSAGGIQEDIIFGRRKLLLL